MESRILILSILSCVLLISFGLVCCLGVICTQKMSAFLEASNQPSHPSSSPGYPGSQPQPMMQTMVATTPVAYPPQQQPVSDGTCCDCANPDIGSRTPLRVIGALVIVLSIVEFGVGGSAASYVRNDGHGSCTKFMNSVMLWSVLLGFCLESSCSRIFMTKFL